jgi:hypothetical protein
MFLPYSAPFPVLPSWRIMQASSLPQCTACADRHSRVLLVIPPAYGQYQHQHSHHVLAGWLLMFPVMQSTHTQGCNANHNSCRGVQPGWCLSGGSLLLNAAPSCIPPCLHMPDLPHQHCANNQPLPINAPATWMHHHVFCTTNMLTPSTATMFHCLCGHCRRSA